MSQSQKSNLRAPSNAALPQNEIAMRAFDTWIAASDRKRCD